MGVRIVSSTDGAKYYMQKVDITSCLTQYIVHVKWIGCCPIAPKVQAFGAQNTGFIGFPLQAYSQIHRAVNSAHTCAHTAI